MDQQAYAAQLQAALDRADIPVSATELVAALLGSFVVMPRQLALAGSWAGKQQDAVDDLLFPDELVDIAVRFLPDAEPSEGRE